MPWRIVTTLARMDRETVAEVLRIAAKQSGLSPQISPAGSSWSQQEIFAYVISPNGEPIALDNRELVEAAGRQVARELIAEVVRAVQSQQRSAPQRPQREIQVPIAGQPYSQDRPDVRGLKLVGDPHAVRVILGPAEAVAVSGETEVERDSGGVYNAFMAGGTVIRLRVAVLIEVAHPNLIAVVPATEAGA
jgi:hypothetical protein